MPTTARDFQGQLSYLSLHMNVLLYNQNIFLKYETDSKADSDWQKHLYNVIGGNVSFFMVCDNNIFHMEGREHCIGNPKFEKNICIYTLFPGDCLWSQYIASSQTTVLSPQTPKERIDVNHTWVTDDVSTTVMKKQTFLLTSNIINSWENINTLKTTSINHINRQRNEGKTSKAYYSNSVMIKIP